VYLTDRFFWLFGASAALFALAFPFGWLFPLAQVFFVFLLALALADGLLLYAKKPALRCERSLNPVFSLSDPNPVRLRLENRGRMHLGLSVADELPEQFQVRDFEVNLALPSGQSRIIENQWTPLTRGIYAFGNTHVFARTRIGMIERRVVFPNAQEVSVYPSIIQMKRYELRAMKHIAHETGIKKIAPHRALV
jgi:Uncharacterized conserved protein (some members contain a von Willebrand factor type A (vWA) domain)